MVKEVDVLTRYNNVTEQWQQDDAETRHKDLGAVEGPSSMIAIPEMEPESPGFSNVPVMIAGLTSAPVSEMVAAVHITHTIWNVNVGALTVDSALDYLGIHAEISVHIELDSNWIECSAQQKFIPTAEMIQRTKVAVSPEFVNGIVVTELCDILFEDGKQIFDLVYVAAGK